uniref:Uncharacterized protein n=1 Tax=Trichogramma kaykai TaxID=54128 RepID=A0ABD2X067_9HYME
MHARHSEKRRTRTRTQTQPSTSLFSSTMVIRAAHELKRDGWRKKRLQKIKHVPRQLQPEYVRRVSCIRTYV